MSITVDLTGMRELEKALREMPAASRRRPALNALRVGGEPIARAARAAAPKGDGNLSESISVSATLAKSQLGDKGRAGDVEMHIGPGQHPQAITQEFGTYFHPAQPFMRPAWEAQRDKALDLIGASLGVEIEKTAARLARRALREYGKRQRR